MPVQVLGLQRTGSNSEDVHANKEGNLGSSIVDESLGTTCDNKDVTDTTNDDTPENHWVATESRVGKITDNKGKAVSQQAERLRSSILYSIQISMRDTQQRLKVDGRRARSYGYLLSQTQGTLSSLTSNWRGTITIATLRQRSIDVVCPNLGTS